MTQGDVNLPLLTEYVCVSVCFLNLKTEGTS